MTGSSCQVHIFFLFTILASQLLTSSGNGMNDSFQLTRASPACSGKEKDRVCKIDKLYYFPCSPKQCPAKNFQECANGKCRTCARQGQDCSEDMPCCDAQAHGIGETGKRENVRSSSCFGGKCKYCINYEKKCGIVGNDRETCCSTVGKKDVECRSIGGTGLCLEDPCDLKKTFPSCKVNGFAKIVQRCNCYLTDNKSEKKYDYECQGEVGMKSCVRCLALGTDCSGGTVEECCPTYLKCGKNKDKKLVCMVKCGPRFFGCTKTDQCCSGLTCYKNYCANADDKTNMLDPFDS